MSADLPELLLADWNYYRTQTRWFHDFRVKRGFTIPDRKMNPKLRGELEATIAWCRERFLEPRLWIFSLFKVRKWIGAPRLVPGVLRSSAMIERYQTMQGVGFFRRRRQATERDEQKAFDPNVDISPAVEGEKVALLRSGQPHVCLEQSIVKTLGFHPSSTVCRSCPVRDLCAIRLSSFVPFDIIGLRLGRIDVDTARKVVEERARLCVVEDG